MTGDTNAADIWRLNHQVLTGTLNDCQEQMSALGIEAKEFFVLAEVENCRYPAALATRLATPKASITVYLKTLEAAGLVQREIDPRDLRRHRLVLTALGSEIRGRAQAILADAFEHALGVLDRKERSQFRRLLEKIVQRATPVDT